MSDAVDRTGGIVLVERMATPSPTSPRRVHPPKHAPHPRIAELRAQGWTDGQIAAAIGASSRAVSRWAAGDTRPLPVYEVNLAQLPPARPGEGSLR